MRISWFVWVLLSRGETLNDLHQCNACITSLSRFFMFELIILSLERLFIFKVSSSFNWNMSYAFLYAFMLPLRAIWITLVFFKKSELSGKLENFQFCAQCFYMCYSQNWKPPSSFCSNRRYVKSAVDTLSNIEFTKFFQQLREVKWR